MRVCICYLKGCAFAADPVLSGRASVGEVVENTSEHIVIWLVTGMVDRAADCIADCIADRAAESKKHV